MDIVQKKSKHIMILEVSGRLDTRTSTELENQVLQILEAGHQHLLMDFSNLDYINSTGLRILVMTFQQLSRTGGQLAVCGIKDYILEIFDISGYDQLFPLFADQNEALDTPWRISAG
ncbi:MAG TPA: STAS domain-containing protein [Desulfomicrobiaceae bacterium]|nr:STAS domain-containing protein [Desulfomicrobiaceae bacterium]